MSVGQLSGWVSQIGGKIDTVADTYITASVSALATALTPVVLVAMTLWWVLLGFRIMRGELQDTVSGAVWKGIKASIILTFALNAALFNSEIVDVYDGLRDGVAGTFATAAYAGTDTVTSGTVWTAIDGMSEDNHTLLNEAAEDVSMFDLPAGIALLLMDLGFLLLSLAAVFIAVIAKIFGTFFLGVGPIFILCLLFKPTQRFFDGWLGMVLNTVVLTWISMFATSFAIHVSSIYAAELTGQWSLSVNPVTTGIQYCGICLILALLIYQSPQWAAALTGGSSMQMGASMARDMAGLWHDGMRRGARGGSGAAGANSVARASMLQRMGSGINAGVSRSAAYLRNSLRGRGA